MVQDKLLKIPVKLAMGVDELKNVKNSVSKSLLVSMRDSVLSFQVRVILVLMEALLVTSMS
jgi:hypothetical protein